MDSSKIKTVVLLILLLVNLAFGAILLADGFRSADVESQARTELVEVLRASGIAMDTAAIPRAPALAGYALTRDEQAEYALVEAVLGPAQAEDRGGNIIYYENEQGWARFHGNGAFELETRYETEASLDELTETWLDRLGIQVDRDSETRHFEDSFRRVEYTCMYGQAELYNCNVVLLFQADGRLEVSGRWMFAEVREQEQADWLSPATVLIRLLAEFRAGGVICERIDAMEQGWLLHASASEGELLPVWQIRTDGGNYYVDCATGALITDLGQ